MTTIAELDVGAQTPDFELITANGDRVSLASLWPERPLALIFLNALDGELTADNAIQWRDADEHMRTAGGEVVAICASSPTAANEFRSRWNLPFALLCDDGWRAYRTFGVTDDLPGSFVLDTEGVVQYAHRNKDPLDFPPTWDVIDSVSGITGQTVDKPELDPIGDERENAEMMEGEAFRPPTPGNRAMLNFTCAKCGYNDYEVMDVSATSGMMSRMVNLQNRRFSAVSCLRCKYTEFYKTESGALRNIFDLMVGT